ncbi:MAG: hypothetical protein CME38_01190 [Haliea sp.]|nr:hypothetical protein [Haliea sp.]
MPWTINELRKTVVRDYVPGKPGIPSHPGQPAIPQREYQVQVEVSEAEYISSAKAPIYDQTAPLGQEHFFGIGPHQFFNGRRAELVGSTMLQGVITYTYRIPATTYTKTIVEPGQPAIPPDPGVPATPAQVTEDNNLGWNAGATGESVLEEGAAFTWRFTEDSVGAVVGLTLPANAHGEHYHTMALSVMGSNGFYTVLEGHGTVTSPRRFTSADEFALVHDEGRLFRVIHNGAVVYEKVIPGDDLVADASLYAAGDAIWDMRGLAAAVEVNEGLGARSKTSALAVAFRALMFGPEPAFGRGQLGAGSKSGATVGSVIVDGEVRVWASATTVSDAGGEAIVQRMLGPGTHLGVAGAATQSDAVAAPVDLATGGADLSMQPLVGAGSVDGVYSGWTGLYPGDACRMAPMECESENGLIVPSYAIGDCVMPPMAGAGSGVSGEITTSADMTMPPLFGVGADYEYAEASVSISPLIAFGSDGGLAGIRGAASLSLTFSLNANDDPVADGAAVLVMRAPFSVSAHGSGAARGALGFALEATGHTENVGRLSGALRLALEASGEVGSYGRLQGAFKLSLAAHGGGRAAGSLPLFALQGQARTGAVGRLSADLGQLFALSAAGVVGSVGRAELTLPGFSSVFTRLRGTLPLFSLRASGHVIEIPGEDGQLAYVVNVANGATSEYHNFPFINVARFRGETLLFGPGGVFRTGGDSDDGEAIVAVAELSPSDFDTSLLKRMPYAYIGLQAEEGVRVTAVADEKEIVAALTSTTGRNRRAKLARGVKGRFWSLKIENTNGEHFAVDSVEYLPMLLRRKV